MDQPGPDGIRRSAGAVEGVAQQLDGSLRAAGVVRPVGGLAPQVDLVRAFATLADLGRYPHLERDSLLVVLMGGLECEDLLRGLGRGQGREIGLGGTIGRVPMVGELCRSAGGAGVGELGPLGEDRGESGVDRPPFRRPTDLPRRSTAR